MNPLEPVVARRAGRLDPPLVTPKGMADLLPPFAAERRALSHDLLRHFSLRGYELVTPPLFEHAVVVEQGKNFFTARDLLRFVEPETGEVAVLRPDITPQIARIVATRLRDRPGPYRLAYEGRVLRRPRGRARMHRQIAQVGIECIGFPSPQGDVETIALAASACEAVGLRDYRVELCTSGLVVPLLDSLPPPARDEVAQVVATKDISALRATGKALSLSGETCQRLENLVSYYGDLSILAQAKEDFAWPQAQRALANLEAITDGLRARGLGPRLRLDLSETRGFTYYTGASFQILAEGPGEAICSGGRYDNLLGQFGTAQPATGFALYVDHLQWALRQNGNRYQLEQPPRAIVAGGSGFAEHDADERVAETLRDAGWAAATLPDQTDPAQVLAFARSWGYHLALVPDGPGRRAVRSHDGATKPLPALDAATLAALAEWASASED